MVPWTHPSPHPKQHLDRFSRFHRAHGRYRQTDRTRYSVCSNRRHLASAAWRTNNTTVHRRPYCGDGHRDLGRHSVRTFYNVIANDVFLQLADLAQVISGVLTTCGPHMSYMCAHVCGIQGRVLHKQHSQRVVMAAVWDDSTSAEQCRKTPS